jgi:membrane-bound lytic murein transglycosylase MltF
VRTGGSAVCFFFDEHGAERGSGLGQITRAFREDGSTRFDALTDMRNRYVNELGELSWNNVKNRPDLQIRTIVLMIRESYQRLAGVSIPMERLAMADAAYNGGIGGTLKERTACGLAKGCDPNYWFNNVENYCLKSKKPLYAGRSACDINRHHAIDTLKTRLPKYEAHYKTYLERMQKT